MIVVVLAAVGLTGVVHVAEAGHVLDEGEHLVGERVHLLARAEAKLTQINRR